MDPMLGPLAHDLRLLSHCGHEYPALETAEATEGEIEDLVAPVPDQEFRLRNYTFRGPSVCRGMLRGEVKPTFGGTPLPIAAKAVRQEDMVDFLATEGRAMHILHNYPHPGFATLREIVEPESGDEDKDLSYLVMDNVDVDLGSYIQGRGRLPEDMARRLFRQLVSAVAHAHKHGIVLRHIRLEKIYFSNKDRTQLVFADLQGAVVLPTGVRCDTERYDLEGVLFDPTTVDVYALGVILHVMLTGDYPFNCGSGLDDGLAISTPLEFPAHATASGSACRLINRMFDDVLTKRPSVLDLLDDPWMNASSKPRCAPRWSVEAQRVSAPGSGSDVVQFSSDSPSFPSLGRRRGSIVLEADTDQVVPERPASDTCRTRRDSPKRKAAPVPQLSAPSRRQRIKIDVSSDNSVQSDPHSKKL